MNEEKKKVIPKYDSRTFEGVVYLRDEVLPSGIVRQVKDIKYLHPIYRQFEIDHYSVGDHVLTKVTNKKRKRTIAQNNFMHLYFTLIAIAHGHGVEMEDIKNWAKGKFLSKGITELYGDKVRKVRGTSDLKVLEMLEFIAKVECETGIPAPDHKPFNLGVTWDEYKELKRKQEEEYRKMKPNIKL